MLHILDVSGFIWRAWHTTPQMTSGGSSVGAVYGFCRMAVALARRHIKQGDSVVACMDPKRKRTSHRSKLYPQYKANREAPPALLVPQFAQTLEAAQEFGFNPVYPIEDVEADDLIASYTLAAWSAGDEVRIHSSDKDLMQLLGDRVTAWDHLNHRLIEAKDVEAKFGVPVYRLRDLLALMGDTADNVPGIDGVGKKYAAKFVTEFGGVEDIIANHEKIQPERFQNKIKKAADKIRLSLELVTLKDDCALPLPLSDLVYRGFTPTLYDYLERMRFPSIIRELEKEPG